MTGPRRSRSRPKTFTSASPGSSFDERRDSLFHCRGAAVARRARHHERGGARDRGGRHRVRDRVRLVERRRARPGQRARGRVLPRSRGAAPPARAGGGRRAGRAARAAPSYAGADYYPFLLAGVKVGVALMLAAIAWRFVRARAAARAGRRLLAALGKRPVERAPRVRIDLKPRLWLAAFTVTSLLYLAQTDAERISIGRWPSLAP